MTWPITGRGEEEGEKLEKTAALQQTFELARGGPLDKATAKVINSVFAFLLVVSYGPPHKPPKIFDITSWFCDKIGPPDTLAFGLPELTGNSTFCQV